MPLVIAIERVLIFAVLIMACCLLPTSVAIQTYLYQALSGILAVLTILTAVARGSLWLASLAVIPAALAVVAPVLLRFIGGSKAFTSSGTAISFPMGVTRRVTYLLLGIVVVVATVKIIAVVPLAEWTSLPWRQVGGVTLILVGLCLWLARAELTAQAIGLLIMDHGLFLVAEPLIAEVGLSIELFVILCLYLLVPFVCLLLVLPRVLQSPLGLDADRLHDLRG